MRPNPLQTPAGGSGGGGGTAPANQAAVLHGINDLRVEPWLLPEQIAPGHVRVAIRAVGICGSDTSYLKKGRIAQFVVEEPMVIGHESAGTVVALGPGVASLAVGDDVALEPGVPCWTHQCSREGRYNLDPGVKFFATPPVHGSLARYVDHPADFCFKLPSGMSHEQGAMCEPLSVGVHACRRAGISPGKSVAILGAGPIGLVTLLAARAFGADCIAITDLVQRNLDLAKQLGADEALRIERDAAPDAIAAQLKQRLAPDGFDVVVDCAGFESTMKTAMDTAAAGGRVVLVGMGDAEMRVPLGGASIREVDILGCFRYVNTYPLCIKLIESRRVDVKPLISHRFGFSQEDVVKGFDTSYRAHETGAIKVMFSLPPPPEA